MLIRRDTSESVTHIYRQGDEIEIAVIEQYPDKVVNVAGSALGDRIFGGAGHGDELFGLRGDFAQRSASASTCAERVPRRADGAAAARRTRLDRLETHLRPVR